MLYLLYEQDFIDGAGMPGFFLNNEVDLTEHLIIVAEPRRTTASRDPRLVDGSREWGRDGWFANTVRDGLASSGGGIIYPLAGE